MKVKVLIIGGGYGALRYVESLIWDETFEVVMCGMEIQGKTKNLAIQYSLPYIAFSELTGEKALSFECIIVALPVWVKKECVRYLLRELEYKNALVLEKPLTLDVSELEFYADSLKNLKRCGIVCQRDFEKERYHIAAADSYHIEFPSNVSEEAFNMEHMLPHVLSWLTTEDDSVELLKHTGENEFCCIWKGASCRIEFVQRTKDNLVTVNGFPYPNVQYRRLNAEIIKCILDFDRRKTEDNINKALKVSRLLIGIM